MPMQKVRKAVMPVAGLGTRFLPATKAIPKEMLPIVDIPAVQLNVEECVASGIEEIVFVTARGKESIADHFDRAPELEALLERKGRNDDLTAIRRLGKLARFSFVRQGEPLGLGHAVLAAASVVGDEPFAVLLGDDLFEGDPPGLAQLLDVHERYGAGAIALTEVPPGQEHLYGVIGGERVSDERRAGQGSGNNSGDAVAAGAAKATAAKATAANVMPTKAPPVWRISQMIEKPAPGTAPSRLAIVGRYVLPGEIFPILERTPPGRGGEIQLTDALAVLCADRGLYGVELQGKRFDAGDRAGYVLAVLHHALRRADIGREVRAGAEQLLRELGDS